VKEWTFSDGSLRCEVGGSRSCRRKICIPWETTVGLVFAALRGNKSSVASSHNKRNSRISLATIRVLLSTKSVHTSSLKVLCALRQGSLVNMPPLWSWLRGFLGLESPIMNEEVDTKDFPRRRTKRTRDQQMRMVKNPRRRRKSRHRSIAQRRTRSQARSEATSSLLASILVPLVNSGHIRAAEVGNLAPVCKLLNEATKDDEIWASFCLREYPCTIRKQHKSGYYLLYKCWTAPVPKRRRLYELSPMPPPLISKRSIHFHLHVSYDGVPIVSRSKRVSSSLLNDCRWTIGASTPAIIGKANWWFNPDNDDDWYYEDYNYQWGQEVICNDFDEEKFDVSLHMSRGTDQARFCLFRSNDREVEFGGCRAHPRLAYGELITPTTEFDLTKEQRYACLGYLPLYRDEHMVFKRSKMATEILYRLPCSIFFDVRLCFGVLEGGHYALTETEIIAYSTVHGRHPEVFNSCYEEQIHGVSLLHILSELQGE
jgi:hypothetical protein